MIDVSTPSPLSRHSDAGGGLGTTPAHLLAIETSGGACSVALWRAGRLVGHERVLLAQGHAARLMPLIERLTAASLGAWSDLDAIAVTVGPGSFTGIRVGLAAARGLGLAARRPVLGVSSFDVIAHMADPGRRGRPLTVVIDPRPGDRSGPPVPLFAQRFDGDLTPLGPPETVPPSALVGVIAGDRPPGNSPAEAIDTGPPDAAVLARLVTEGRVATLAPRPLYLKPPDVSQPRAAASP